MTHTPYSETDDETDLYRFTGSYMKLPNGGTIERGENVELPDRVAAPIEDLLEPIDSAIETESEATNDSGGESGADAAENDTSDSDTQPSDASSDAEKADSGSSLVDVESEDTPDAFPAEVPDAESWGWDVLQEVSKANDVNAAQSKEEQVADLRSIAGK